MLKGSQNNLAFKMCHQYREGEHHHSQWDKVTKCKKEPSSTKNSLGDELS